MDSVYGLLNALCELICIKKERRFDQTTVRRCRKKAFEILFEASYGTNFPQNSNIVEDLQICVFEHRLRADTEKQKELVHEFERCLENLVKTGVVKELANVLEFLLHLRDANQNVANDNQFSDQSILRPLNKAYLLTPSKRLSTDNRYYQKYLLPENVTSNDTNPYLPAFRNSESNLSFTYIFNNQQQLLEKVRNYTDNKSNIFNQNSGSISSSSLKNCTKAEFTRSYLASGSVSRTDGASRRSFRRSSGRQRRIFNWENLGNRNVQRELLFSSETGCLLPLHAVKAESLHEDFVANIIPLDEFMIDVKYLIVGVSSESFIFNSELTFAMVANLTLDNVTSNTFKSIITEFIECGTCFKRLQLMTMRKDPNTFDHIYGGLIFKALCESVETYLISFRKLVLSFNDAAVLSLHKRTIGLRKQITTLAKILDIHPTSDGKKKLAQGVQFLVCLFKATVPITEPEVRTFLMFILKNCCQVYFSCFEKWIFQGHLVDHHNELFIHYVGAGNNEKTKAFFDKAYQIRRDCIPAFLHGLETEILVCGKYTMLLRQYNPSHPIFTMDRFRLKVCVTFSEQKKLEQQCEEYQRKAKALCGPPITTAQVLKQKEQKRLALQKLVAEKAKQNLEKWKIEQELRITELNKTREHQREELKLQIEEIREQKLSEKKANIERELIYLKEAQEVEDQRLLSDNVERRKRIEYYEELHRMINEKQARTEKLVVKLRNELKTKPDSIMAMSIGSENLSPEDDKTKRISLSASSLSSIESIITEEGVCSDNLTKMKKSKSDIINANHIMENELFKKRHKVLDSKLVDNLNLDLLSNSEKTKQPLRDLGNNNFLTGTSLTEAQQNELRVLPPKLGFGLESFELRETDDLTEAMKNKAYILGTNFQLGQIPEVSDNINSQCKELTDLQKNRNKIMLQEYGFLENLTAPKRRSDMSLETARSRNRRKVLESEFNITIGEKTSESCPENCNNRTTVTPITPDPDLIANLNLDIRIVNEKIPISHEVSNKAKIKQPLSDGAYDTKSVAIGFECPIPSLNIVSSVKSQKLISNPLHDKSHYKIDTLCDDFVKIMQRKMYSLMPLNLSVVSTQYDESHESSKLNKYDELLFLDSMTLTNFFQRSISLPLDAHMEIINSEILRLFLIDLDVIGHFKSLRNFFFMMDGEFGMTICDGLLKELESGVKPPQLLNFQTLHALLETALGSSFGGTDKNTEKLAFQVETVPDEFDLNSPDALQMLSLQYKVSWPLKLILNTESLQQYSNIFKYLVKVRRLSWVLEASFQYLKESRKKLGAYVIRAPQYRRIEEIRHKLTQFMQALLNHITKTALQESWKKFKTDLAKTTSIEQIYRRHVSYIKRILFVLMLKDKCGKFRDYLERAFILIMKFYRYLVSCSFLVDPTDSKNFIHPHYEKLLRIEKHFKIQVDAMLLIGLKMVNTGFQPEIGEFLNLINMNNYYEPQFSSY